MNLKIVLGLLAASFGQVVCEAQDCVMLKGSIVPDGTRLERRNGVYRGKVTLDKVAKGSYADRVVFFDADHDGQPDIKPIRLNNGVYDVTYDVDSKEYKIEAPIDENRISVFGSSVSNGVGAAGLKGYAYMYDQELQRRAASGESGTPFRISSVAINGNNTMSLLGRFDDLVHDFGRYVIFGLSLGNEGIHEAKDKEKVFLQFNDNMKLLINKARGEGKIPVVMNNYTRGDFTAEDYECVKRLNLLIHEWDVPSVNTLGAIDDGTGRWANGYEADPYHPTAEGHEQFMKAMDPTLFDAIKSGKPLPERVSDGETCLGGNKALAFDVKGVNPFAVCLRFHGGKAGDILHFNEENIPGDYKVSVGTDGHVSLTTPDGGKIQGFTYVCDKRPHTITLSHYYAQGWLYLYVDNVLQGYLPAKLSPKSFKVVDASGKRAFMELAFWRSALNDFEVNNWNSGHLLRSSMEIYTPLNNIGADGKIPNMAQSMNESLRIE